MNISLETVCQMLGERDVRNRILVERIAVLEKELAALKPPPEKKDANG